MKITRRRLGAVLLVPAAANAQAPAKPATPEEELAAARGRIKGTIETLRKTPVGITVEPDFAFRA